MRKLLECSHFKRVSKETDIYLYDLINGTLCLCKKCEKKLRKKVLEQEKIEKELVIKKK